MALHNLLYYYRISETMASSRPNFNRWIKWIFYHFYTFKSHFEWTRWKILKSCWLVYVTRQEATYLFRHHEVILSSNSSWFQLIIALLIMGNVFPKCVPADKKLIRTKIRKMCLFLKLLWFEWNCYFNNVNEASMDSKINYLIILQSISSISDSYMGIKKCVEK